jgi:hypothetical protein
MQRSWKCGCMEMVGVGRAGSVERSRSYRPGAGSVLALASHLLSL